MSKSLLTVSVTVIESFRQWINAGEDNDKPWVCEENVVLNVKGVESVNVKADYGTAGHAIIEDAEAYKTNTGYQVKEFIFSDTQALPLIKFRQDHPLMTREIALSKIYHTRHFDIAITGTCDHMEANDMRDTKFKFSSIDVAEYMDSVQWRLYLDMAGMKRFIFDFFPVSGFNTIADCAKATIKTCESMPLNAYPVMEDDIQAILEDFADWIVFKELQDYLVITPAKQKRILRGDPSLKALIA